MQSNKSNLLALELEAGEVVGGIKVVHKTKFFGVLTGDMHGREESMAEF